MMEQMNKEQQINRILGFTTLVWCGGIVFGSILHRISLEVASILGAVVFLIVDQIAEKVVRRILR